MTKIFDFEINEVDEEIFKQIPNTNCFINKNGILHKRDTNELKDIKTYKVKKGSYIFIINGKRYYLKSILKQLFNIDFKINDDVISLKQLFKEKETKDPNDKFHIIETKQNKILKDGFYKNHLIVKDIPNDLKQVKEYNNYIIRDCYYFSDNKYQLYHKIDNTNLYFEIKDKRPDLSQMYCYDRKYYRIKTNNNKTITFVLYRKNKNLI